MSMYKVTFTTTIRVEADSKEDSIIKAKEELARLVADDFEVLSKTAKIKNEDITTGIKILYTWRKEHKDDMFAAKVLDNMMDRLVAANTSCEEVSALEQDICQEGKTYENLLKYVTNKAQEYLKNKPGAVEDETVFEWAEDYFHINEKELAEKKAKEEAERKSKAEATKKKSTKKK